MTEFLAPDLTPYAGRWVALSRLSPGIAGIGRTADEALAHAQYNRPKERFDAYLVPETLRLPAIVDQVRPILATLHAPAYLVGGCVRDALLGRPSHDLDFVVVEQGRAIPLCFKVANALGWPAYVMDRERDIGRCVAPDHRVMLDFAGLRGPDLLTDLRERDFTLNALALPADSDRVAAIIDPCGGVADALAGRLRQTHAQAITSDPVRALRAARLAAQLECTPTPDTVRAARAGAAGLAQISAERLRDEFLKLLMTPAPAEPLRHIDAWGLLTHISPELTALRDVAQSAPHHEAVLAHTFSVLHWLALLERHLTGDHSAPLPQGAAPVLETYRPVLQTHLARAIDGGLTGRHVLRLGALFHDVGKAATQTVTPDGRIRFLDHPQVGADIAGQRLQALKLSNVAIQQVKQIVVDHMRPLSLLSEESVSRRAVYRFFRSAGLVGPDITLLALADHLATYDGAGDASNWTRLLQLSARFFQTYFEQFEQNVQPRPLVNGRQLMRALGIPSGPPIGRLMRQLEEAQAVGEIQTPAEALDLARRLIDRND